MRVSQRSADPNGGIPATVRAAFAALGAGELVVVMWRLAEVVGLLEWRLDYGGGADDLANGNLTVHAWLIGTGTALAGLLAARLPVGGRHAYLWAAVGALVGGLLAGAVVGGTVPEAPYAVASSEVLQTGALGAAAGALAVLSGTVSSGALPGLLLGTALPWAAYLVWPYALAFPGFDGSLLRADSLLVPLACTLLPALLAAAVGRRGGAGWAGAVLGALQAPGMLLVAYHTAGQGGGDHLGQIVPYWFMHLLAPAAVVAIAAGPAALVCWRALDWSARVAALVTGLIVVQVLFPVSLPSLHPFTLGRDTRITFTVEVVVLVVGAVCAVLAGIAVATALAWKAGWRAPADSQPDPAGGLVPGQASTPASPPALD